MKTKAHQLYKKQDGTIVPGMTTLTGQLNKPALVTWANRLGLQGHDVNKFRDEKAQIGDLVHRMILADLKGETIDAGDWSRNQINAAENSFFSWMEWKERHDIEPIAVEQQFVSELYDFGGTPDFIGWIDGRLCLGDYKTGGIYDEAIIQTCGYKLLWEEWEDTTIEEIVILGIPRTPDENFAEKHIRDFNAGTEAVLCLSQLYWVMKRIRTKG